MSQTEGSGGAPRADEQHSQATACGHGPSPQPEPHPLDGQVRSRALAASVWTVGGFGMGQMLRFLGNLVLTRLLFPEVFGLATLVSTFVMGLAMFTDVGAGPAIVQSASGQDPSFLRTAWTIQTVRGFVLFLASCVIAYPVASFYGQPILAWLVPAAGLTAVLSGFESTAMHSEQRHLRVARYSIIDLTSQAVTILATITLAWLDRRVYGPHHPGAVWAAIFGPMVGTLVRTILSHTALPNIGHRFEFAREHARTLLRFGRWIVVSSVLYFFSGQLDRLIFGKMIPIDLFGVFGIAATLAALPPQVAHKLGSMVLFPAYSRLLGRGDFRPTFLRARLPVLLGGALLTCGLIACGPFLIRSLYDRRYQDAGWILQFLAVGGWFQILEVVNGSALLAQGRTRWYAFPQGVKVASVIVLAPIGFHLGGFLGALLALTVSDFAKYVASSVALVHHDLSPIGHDLLASLGLALLSTLGFLAGAGLTAWTGHQVAGLLGSMLVVCGASAPVGLWYLRHERGLRLASLEAADAAS